MSKPITIACELIITPGGPTQQNKITIRTENGETAMEVYEQNLSNDERKLIAAIVSAESRLLNKFAQKLEDK